MGNKRTPIFSICYKKRNESPQKQTLPKMVMNYLKENDVKCKDGSDA